MEAWYTTDGQWYQTETDLTFAELPDEVKSAFQSGNSRDWRMDDVDMIERKETQTFYILDVEKGGKDYDLHYLPNGDMIKEVEDRS